MAKLSLSRAKRGPHHQERRADMYWKDPVDAPMGDRRNIRWREPTCGVLEEHRSVFPIGRRPFAGDARRSVRPRACPILLLRSGTSVTWPGDHEPQAAHPRIPEVPSNRSFPIGRQGPGTATLISRTNQFVIRVRLDPLMSRPRDLFSVNPHVRRPRETELDPTSADRQHRHFHRIADPDPLTTLSTEN